MYLKSLDIFAPAIISATGQNMDNTDQKFSLFSYLSPKLPLDHPLAPNNCFSHMSYPPVVSFFLCYPCTTKNKKQTRY